MATAIKAKLAVGLLVLLVLAPTPAPRVNETMPPTGAQDVFFVSPGGSGSECSKASPCSLAGGRERVRAVNGDMNGDVVVYLLGGTYELSSPFELNGEDSGSGGHDVVYEAYRGETPVVSGGTRVSGWVLHDREKGVYRARVDPALEARQLYVDGARATRARSELNPSGFVKEADGYSAGGLRMQGWGNKSDVELVDLEQWRNIRCGVSSISADGRVRMKQPCWKNAQLDGAWDDSMPLMDEPAWIENAHELLDEPGEWYLDRSEDFAYYKPRPGENLSTAYVVAPRLGALVKGTGTLDDPVHDICFRGITFAYTTWLRPGTDDGYAAVQAGFHRIGERGRVEGTPASLAFWAARSVVLDRNTLTHLGSAGISFGYGSQDNVVSANHLEDLSGGGIYLGGTEDHHPSDARMVVKDNVVENNTITRIGAEFFDGVGIWVGYTDGSRIEHNELSDLPYSGISVGWGWGGTDPGGYEGYTTPTTARDNAVRHNLIRRYMMVLNDGGGVYLLGSQPGTVVSGNYVHDQRESEGGLYLDRGTRGVTVERNVVSSTPRWLFFTDPSVRNNAAAHNYADTPATINGDAGNTVSDNLVVEDGDWPEEARRIMDGAGLEPGYRREAGQEG